MRPNIFLATIGRGSNGSNALEVTEDRAAVTAESQDNIINRVNNVSQYGPSWHYVPGIGVAGTAYAEVPDRSLGDLAFSRASSKTRTNAAGVVETIGNNVPPHDYRNADGTLSTFPRLNLEPQRTNSIRNSSMVGAVAGTPGTTPTNWTVVTAGLTQTISVGTDNGLPYVDLRFNGTASGSIVRINSEATTQIAASNGQAWASSTYMRRISGTYDSSTLGFGMRTSAGAGLGALTAAISLTTSLQRFVFVGTTNNASVAFVQPQIDFIVTIGTAYDFTIRIAAPQMELGAYATTWVPTTTAAVTRIADAASKTGLSSLFGTQGTWFLEMSPSSVGVSTTAFKKVIGLFQVNGSISDCIYLEEYNGNWGVFVRKGNTTILSRTYGTQPRKLAVTFGATGSRIYIDGVQETSTASNTSINPVQISVRELTGGAIETVLNVTQSAYIPTPLTRTQLAQLTTL